MAPVAPLGIVKFKIASCAVPVLVTVAFVPAAPVEVVPMLILPSPASPVGPVGPVFPKQ